MATKFLCFLVAIYAALLVGASSAGANLLQNGSFEEVKVTAPDWFVRSNTSTPGWTQILDGVDLIHSKFQTLYPTQVLVTAQDGVNYLDMNQLNVLGGIEQVVDATAGVTYHLSLYTTAWATNSIPGTIGYEFYDPATNSTLASGQYKDSGQNADLINHTNKWILCSLDANAISDHIGVRIYGIAAYQAGMGLDNVSLDAVNAVPLPGAVWLLGSGLLGLVGLRRFRKS